MVARLNTFGRAMLLFLTFTTASAVFAQEPKARQWSRAELIAAAREVITTARYCALITTGADGRAQARTMDPFAPAGDMTVWFGTNPRSRKVAEIRRRPRVTIYYFDRDSQSYVTIHGVGRLVNNDDEKAKHWKSEWSGFYPSRERDYMLIEVKPERLEIVSVQKGIVGDTVRWDPPAVKFSRRK
jgi:general stress protein 26